MYITTFKYKLHITLSYSTHSKPHHTSHTAFQPPFLTTPGLIWRQTIPHHVVFYNHISHLASQHTTTFPMHHTIIPHCNTTFHTWHCTTLQHHMSHIFYIHLIPHHSHIRMNKAQHPTSGIAKRCTSHQIPHTTLFHITPCDLVVLKYVKCGVIWNDVRCKMCCVGNVVWCEILLSCGSEMWNV